MIFWAQMKDNFIANEGTTGPQPGASYPKGPGGNLHKVNIMWSNSMK